MALLFTFVLVGFRNIKATQLGTSDFSIVLPTGYASVEVDFDEDQVAYYYKDDNEFKDGDGLIKKGVENTIRAIGSLARV